MVIKPPCMNLMLFATKKPVSTVKKHRVIGMDCYRERFLTLKYNNNNMVVMSMVMLMDKPYAASMFDEDLNIHTTIIHSTINA